MFNIQEVRRGLCFRDICASCGWSFRDYIAVAGERKKGGMLENTEHEIVLNQLQYTACPV